jgi:hypothetical protein
MKYALIIATVAAIATPDRMVEPKKAKILGGAKLAGH